MKLNGLLVLIVACILLIGAMDYNDDVNQEKRYCAMVESGNWPDYDKNINCKKEQ